MWYNGIVITWGWWQIIAELIIKYLIVIQVVDGAYDGVKLKSTDQAILSDSGLDKNIGYSAPLEIMPAGQFEPLYKTTLSIQV